MLKSWRVGRFFGIDVFVHWSFWILPIVFIVMTSSYGWVQTPLAFLTIMLAFVCVVLHEYGHALTARLFGIRTRDIVLFPLGGMARLERMSEKPLEEILITIAGPAVNVLLFFLGAAAFGAPWSLLQGGRTPEFTDFGVVAQYLVLFNAVMIFFNLIPAFPMDGGRLLRAFLALFLDRITATQLAVTVAFGMAGLFIILGVAFVSPMYVLAGVFVMLLGPLELAMLKRQEALRQRRAYAEDVEAFDEYESSVTIAPPEPDFTGYTWDSRFHAWIEWHNGWPVRKCRMRAW
jgi:Zn-dependent protease